MIDRDIRDAIPVMCSGKVHRVYVPEGYVRVTDGMFTKHHRVYDPLERKFKHIERLNGWPIRSLNHQLIIRPVVKET